MENYYLFEPLIDEEYFEVVGGVSWPVVFGGACGVVAGIFALPGGVAVCTIAAGGVMILAGICY